MVPTLPNGHVQTTPALNYLRNDGDINCERIDSNVEGFIDLGAEKNISDIIIVAENSKTWLNDNVCY